ncbi:hypothetical protein RRG08_014934 [Elysia crispata]|uniref:Uncharacterized protein n=1 Tax=Elysia crispata TaxID=231223 RepID=A0AAE1B1T1_9GAST|nr:hypothetical protein RRG08_014934 [Elysia crispata]
MISPRTVGHLSRLLPSRVVVCVCVQQSQKERKYFGVVSGTCISLDALRVTEPQIAQAAVSIEMRMWKFRVLSPTGSHELLLEPSSAPMEVKLVKKSKAKKKKNPERNQNG